MTLLDPLPGTEPRIGPCHDVVWLGGDRMLDWFSPKGVYRFYDRRLPCEGEEFSPVEEGSWPSRVGRRFAWLGGDQLLEWEPGRDIYTVWQCVVQSTPRDPKGSPELLQGPVASGFWDEGAEGGVTYLGRGYVLAADPSAGGHRLWRWTGKELQSADMPADAAVGKWIGAQERRWLRFAWLGADRLLVWNVASGESLPLRWGRRLRPEPALKFGDPDLPDLAGRGLAYVGHGTLFGWRREPPAKDGGLPSGNPPPIDCFRGHIDETPVASQGWTIVPPSELHPPPDRGIVSISGFEMLPGIEDYLEQHPNVRAAIRWPSEAGSVPYNEWNLQPATAEFHLVLAKLYRNLEFGAALEFSFRTIGERPILTAGTLLQPRDASEIFLAHVAHSLWVEIHRKVEWKLHEYPSGELELLLDGASMFLPRASGLYSASSNVSGRHAMPMDPTRSYTFLKTQTAEGRSLVGASARDTILQVTRWVRDHLRHGDSAASGQGEMPFLDTILEPTVNPALPGFGVRHWSWWGCQSGAALMVWLMRAINIPARSAPSFIHEPEIIGVHACIDFPSERLFRGHFDDFYAMPELLDPTIEPTQIYTNAPDYAAVSARYTIAPTAGEARHAEYHQTIGHIGLAHPTFYYVDLYWQEKIYGTIILDQGLSGLGFSATDILDLRATYIPVLEAAIRAFKDDRPPDESDSDGWEAYRIAYAAWKNNR